MCIFNILGEKGDPEDQKGCFCFLSDYLRNVKNRVTGINSIDGLIISG